MGATVTASTLFKGESSKAFLREKLLLPSRQSNLQNDGDRKVIKRQFEPLKNQSRNIKSYVSWKDPESSGANTWNRPFVLTKKMLLPITTESKMG